MENNSDKRYTIKATLTAPAGVNTDGYSVYDYFRTDITALFQTPEMAEQVAESGYLGPDEHGVGCTWQVVEYIL